MAGDGGKRTSASLDVMSPAFQARTRDFPGVSNNRESAQVHLQGMLRVLGRRKPKVRILNKNTSPQIEMKSQKKENREIRTFPWNGIQWPRAASTWVVVLSCVVGFAGVKNFGPGTGAESAALAVWSGELSRPQQEDPAGG